MRGSSTLHGLIALSTVLSLASCAGGSEWWRTVQWEDYTLQRLPQSQSYPGVGAIILLDEGTMEPFGSGVLGYSVFEQHRIVRVFDARGERYANVVLPYGTSSEIEDIRARTITPSGLILPLRQEDVHDVNLYPDFVFFSDQRAKIFTLPGVEPGAVLEYRYRLKVSNRTVWHGWRFQSDVPTLISRFTMLVPSEWPVSFRTYGIEIEPDIRRVPNGFKSTFRWEARDLPAMVNETGMPPASERSARLTIAPLGFKTWNDVAAWYRKLSEPREDDNAGIEFLVDSLIAGVSEPDQRMRILYEWVRDHVRYLAVEIGIGGFQPHRSGEICANRYGDCKDMATLLSAMGDAAGISIEQVLISTWQNGTPDTALPSPYHFNHAISYAPDLRGGLWMDATAKGAPYGELPWYDQGVPVLVVGDDGKATIHVTPRVEPPANSERVSWTASLDDSGRARVRARIVLRGALAMEARDDLTYATEQERRRWIEERLPRECASGAVIEALSMTGLAPVEDSLALEVDFSAPLFAGQEEDALRFRPGMIIASGLPDLFRPGPRQHPVRFRFGMQRELVLDVTVPTGWYVSFSPPADSSITPFGSWSSILSTTPRGLHFRRLVRLKGQEIHPGEYATYRRFLDSLRTSEHQGVILRRPRSEIPTRASDTGNPPSGLRAEPGNPHSGARQPGEPAEVTADSVSGI
jgi:hypothetical protein